MSESKKLTVAQAAEQWVAAKREIARQNGLIAEAAPVLLAHFAKAKRNTYKDLIRRKPTGGGWVLDSKKIREHFGARIRDFQKQQADGFTLELLEKDAPAG